MDKSPVKFIRAGVFGLVIVCFFFPFVLISCPGNQSRQVTGIGLITGGDVRWDRQVALNNDVHYRPSVTALIALLCAVAGLVCSFLKPKLAFALCLAAAAGGLVCMALLRPEIAAWAARYARNRITFSLRWGFWAALSGFIAALLVTIVFNPFAKLAFPTFKAKSGRKRRR